MNRRRTLKILGGGTVIGALAATGYVLTRTPTQALAPWNMAGTYQDPRMRALSWAILAPNPHNQQPWLVELTGQDTVILRFNPEQDLPATDPFDRQLCIGLGCFLELMTMAANADGRHVEITLFPEGTNPETLAGAPVAQVRFSTDATIPTDPLWPQVPHRRTNRNPHDEARPIPPDVLSEMTAVAGGGNVIGGTVEPEDLTYWRDLTTRALKIELETPETYLESVNVFRIGKQEINATPDGLSFPGAQFEIMNALGLFSREAAGDMQSTAYRQGVRMELEKLSNSMGFLWLVSPGNTREDQIKTGRGWLRAHLTATKLGLAFQPLSQALQEYPEMNDLYREVHDRLAPKGGTVQMLIRLGYARDVAPSPRWPIDAKVIAV